MTRPDHPDFSLLTAVVRELDRLAEAGTPLPEVIDPIDIKTATYVAVQRAMRIGATPAEQVHRLTRGEQQRAAAAWLDGLVAGYRLREAHEKKENDHE